MYLIKNKNFNTAFTLAEVIIVMGIIGILAEMTLPTLIKDVQKQILKTTAMKAFSEAAGAVQKMRQDEGGSLNYYYTTLRTFKPVYMKYFKILRDCDMSDCVPNVGGVAQGYKSLTGEGAYPHRMDEGQFVTQDGMFYAIENGGVMIFITIDVNGYDKKPNVFGEDTFMFQIINDNLVPMGASSSYYPVRTSYSFCDRTYNATSQGFGCMANVVDGRSY